jgi:hypothetical protein
MVYETDSRRPGFSLWKSRRLSFLLLFMDAGRAIAANGDTFWALSGRSRMDCAAVG